MKIFGLEIKREKSIQSTEIMRHGVIVAPEMLFGRFNPYAESNFLNTYKYIGEVQYPIRYLTDRALKGNILLKRFSDDSVVWNNEYVNKLMLQANYCESFKELMVEYIVMRLITGNAYIYADTEQIFSKSLYKYCDRYFVLPSQDVFAELDIAKPFTEDKVKYYNCTYLNQLRRIPKELVLHIKDSKDYDEETFKGFSRLLSQKYTLANLVAVYEARNVIYTKRGALGAIISGKSDQDGTQPLTPKEIEELQDKFQRNYGLRSDKNQLVISEAPISYVQFGKSISELQPFEETLQDAIQIAGIFGVNKELIPRKDNSTFSNQRAAEIDCYSNVVMPLVNEFLDKFSHWAGLYNDRLYLSADFSQVDILVANRKEREEKNRIISEKCKMEFNMGIITLNDWRTQLDMDRIEDSLYDKTLPQMSDADVARLRKILV